MLRYALITPAYNEQENLPRLSEAILAQTTLPLIWVLVNDGSEDDTASIINTLAQKHSFIHALHLTRDDLSSYYARKIHVFNHGYKYLGSLNLPYDFIGNLDADISMYPNYYCDVLAEFSKDENLGVAGGQYRYITTKKRIIWSGNYVPGSILLARRKCFEDTGGYKPLQFGAEDTLLCIMAEMKGWRTACFPQYKVIQHRIVGTAGGLSILKARYRQGQADYDIGYHPVFCLLRCLKRCFAENPYVLGGLARYCGYIAGTINQSRDHVDHEVVKFLRKKQCERLKIMKYIK